VIKHVENFSEDFSFTLLASQGRVLGPEQKWQGPTLSIAGAATGVLQLSDSIRIF